MRSGLVQEPLPPKDGDKGTKVRPSRGRAASAAPSPHEAHGRDAAWARAASSGHTWGRSRGTRLGPCSCPAARRRDPPSPRDPGRPDHCARAPCCRLGARRARPRGAVPGPAKHGSPRLHVAVRKRRDRFPFNTQAAVFGSVAEEGAALNSCPQGCKRRQDFPAVPWESGSGVRTHSEISHRNWWYLLQPLGLGKASRAPLACKVSLRRPEGARASASGEVGPREGWHRCRRAGSSRPSSPASPWPAGPRPVTAAPEDIRRGRTGPCQGGSRPVSPAALLTFSEVGRGTSESDPMSVPSGTVGEGHGHCFSWPGREPAAGHMHVGRLSPSCFQGPTRALSIGKVTAPWGVVTPPSWEPIVLPRTRTPEGEGWCLSRARGGDTRGGGGSGEPESHGLQTRRGHSQSDSWGWSRGGRRWAWTPGAKKREVSSTRGQRT